MENKNIVILGNVVFGVLIFIATVLFMFTSIDPYIIKTTDSALFVLCGVFNLMLLYKLKNKGSIWKSFIMLAGLVFAFIGDVVLISNFVLGAIFFAIGHILFLVYFYLLQKFNWKDLVFGGVIFLIALMLILFLPSFNFGEMKLIVIIYALIISLMLGKALSNYIQKPNVANLILFLGAFLFFFSDVMLVFNRFTDISVLFDYFCLATYYPAEFLLALSIYLQNYENNKEIKSDTIKEQ